MQPFTITEWCCNKTCILWLVGCDGSVLQNVGEYISSDGSLGKTKLCKVAPNSCNIITAGFSPYSTKNVYRSTCVGQQAPCQSQVHESFRNLQRRTCFT
jgi:hypothetical protein